jgi:hypothetical protein
MATAPLHHLRGGRSRSIIDGHVAEGAAVRALTDPLPAGFEAVDTFRTTAADVAREAERTDSQETGDWWRRGGFDRIEKYDDRVRFATPRRWPPRVLT